MWNKVWIKIISNDDKFVVLYQPRYMTHKTVYFHILALSRWHYDIGIIVWCLAWILCTWTHHFYVWFKYDLGQKYQATQIRPDLGSNSWPPDCDSTFHVIETPALTTRPSVTCISEFDWAMAWVFFFALRCINLHIKHTWNKQITFLHIFPFPMIPIPNTISPRWKESTPDTKLYVVQSQFLIRKDS